jgi:hypothetical protein
MVDANGNTQTSGIIDRNNYNDFSEGTINVYRAAIALANGADYEDTAKKYDTAKGVVAKVADFFLGVSNAQKSGEAAFDYLNGKPLITTDPWHKCSGFEQCTIYSAARKATGSISAAGNLTVQGELILLGKAQAAAVAAQEEQLLLQRANAARDALLKQLSGVSSSKRPATVVGAFNTKTGAVGTGQSSAVLQECAEACAARNVGGNISDIKFTVANRPNASGPPYRSIAVCQQYCQSTYSRSAFPDPATLFVSGP